jgi:hypothetical protein
MALCLLLSQSENSILSGKTIAAHGGKTIACETAAKKEHACREPAKKQPSVGMGLIYGRTVGDEILVGIKL